ncbi:guanine deaminase [Methylophaga sp.]|uniref:guanine deaminase n=1 Tax=Methylophaga sp. TaxID=2024840 RepID=UPI00272484BC|nr:guanine deaminase [Methylophaga sp.]MDO8826848.1 guanine deaminase [Methylophaga sp.]
MRYAIRADFLHFTDEPDAKQQTGYSYIQDGLLIVNNGLVEQLGLASELQPLLEDDVLVDESNKGKLIIPGMIDAHTHYPQIDMIASYGEQLLDWLNTYTFPAEMRFGDKRYARDVAERFLHECFINGTTTAMVFCSKHPESVDAFFEVASQYKARMIAGKVMMDRHAPDQLLDTAEQSYYDTKRLIEKWHGYERLFYAITPRFAPTSTPEQLLNAATLKQQFEDVYIHSHISENKAEVAWVKSLYPNCEGYLDVYKQHGLLTDRTVLAHGVHLEDTELQTMAEYGASIAFCPTSNLFLGSGLFDVERCKAFAVEFSLATDVGAGTSFSMLKTMRAAYEVGQLQGHSVHPLTAFYWVTLGNAKTLKLDSYIGNFERGKEADFIVLNPNSTSVMSYRYSLCETLEEKLFAMMCLGDDRLIEKTYILGKKVHDKSID